MEIVEIRNVKIFESFRPLPKIIIFEDIWMKKLDSEVVGHSESSQQTQPKTTHPIVRTGRLVSTKPPSSSSVQEIDKRCKAPMCLFCVQLKTKTQTKT